jgi:hypothetical protein
MNSLLLDYTNVIKTQQIQLLTNHIKQKPNTRHNLGLILIIPRKSLQTLREIPEVIEKIKYLGSVEFVESIAEWVYVIYNSNKKICELLVPPPKYMELIIDTLMRSLPNDITLIVKSSIVNTDLIKEYINVGFINPYISLRGNLCMSKKNNALPSDKSEDEIAIQTSYILSQKLPDCSAILQFDLPTLNYLKTLTTVGLTFNKNTGNITQKEIAGTLKVIRTTKEFVHILEVVQESIIIGDEEGVPIAVGLYNFHSHPKEAYERHMVELAWPSAQDYVGFLLAVRDDSTICHFVISIEGIYIISLSTQFDVRIDNDIIEFIQKKYDISYNSVPDSIEYIKKINDLLYKDLPIFDCQYLNWEDSGTPFTVNFGRRDSNCNCYISPEQHQFHND